MSDIHSSSSPLQADPQLQRYFSSEDERRGETRKLFDAAASGYDKAERITALGTGPWYRRQALTRAGLKAGMTILDVAAGTGLVTREALALVGPQGKLLALDPSPGMLAELKAQLPVETLEAYAEQIPLPDACVDFVSMGYALRHVADLETAFREYVRVLRPGGQVCIMEITRPESALGQLLLRGYIRGLVPLLARLTRCNPHISRLWEYYWDTIQACVAPEAVMAAMVQAGFSDVRCNVSLGTFREYMGSKPVAS